MKLTPRLYLCLLCYKQVIICRHCDRGNIYCGWVCAQKARTKSLHLAGSRYQSTLKGKCCHAARQARYRIRLRKKVTHQGSLNPLLNDSIKSRKNSPKKIKSNQDCVISRCQFCNKLVAQWVRNDFLRRRDRKKSVLVAIFPQGP
jgi:hypothetical protein